MKCESCQIKNIEIEESSAGGNGPYRLCRACHERMLNYALRPLEFFNLAAIHGPVFYLHDDFYDDRTGVALQPKTKVVHAVSFPFPDLADIKGDVHKLVDYACVPYSMPAEVIDLLKVHDKEAILRYIQDKASYNGAIRGRAYQIAGKVLQSTARQWISKEWDNRKEGELPIFAEAMAKCLPFEQAFGLVTAEIEVSAANSFAGNGMALMYFESRQTLEWIEKISPQIINVSTNWGTLSAASQFSWDIAHNWLDIGRPLSLIALDALVFCTTRGERHNQHLWLVENPPTLIDGAPSSIITATITEYLQKNNVPRTKSAVAQIIHNLF